MSHEESQGVKEVIHELDAPTTPPEKQKRSLRDPHLSLVAFLGVALIATSLIVLTGHIMYVTSNEYKLDITRPGLKGIKKEELVTVDRTADYDSSSPVDQQAAKAEADSMSSRLEDLDKYGDFADQELTQLQDEALNGPIVNSTE